MEVRKLLLEFIMTSSSTTLGKVLPAFFRDEYQDDSGNLSHIHGLIGLLRADMENSEFKDFVCSLQRSAVCDLITTDEIPDYIEKGLLKDFDDFKEYTDTAACVLNHSCASRRCLVRQGDSGTPNDFRCKKPHPVKDSMDPIENEWIPFNYCWSDSCLDVLRECELYEEPSDEYPRGRFLNDVLDPKRHMGKVTASTQENLSPVIPELFALTRSQQNAQVLTGTNSISRYIAKYVVKMDAGNRCVIWADSHTGAVSGRRWNTIDLDLYIFLIVLSHIFRFYEPNVSSFTTQRLHALRYLKQVPTKSHVPVISLLGDILLLLRCSSKCLDTMMSRTISLLRSLNQNLLSFVKRHE